MEAKVMKQSKNRTDTKKITKRKEKVMKQKQKEPILKKQYCNRNKKKRN